VEQLRAAGAAKVFNETASGAKTDRIQLRRALDQLALGDVLMLTRSRRFRARQHTRLGGFCRAGSRKRSTEAIQ
jgi:hypothetical protein